MKSTLLIYILLFYSTYSFSQKFYLGNYLQPTDNEFQITGISSKTGVTTYRYKKEKYDLLYGRKVGDITVGIRNGIIVTTIYNLIPKGTDIGVPPDIINVIQDNLPFPLAERNGIWGANIDNESMSIARINNVLTYGKDRIMIMNSIKQSILIQTK